MSRGGFGRQILRNAAARTASAQLQNAAFDHAGIGCKERPIREATRKVAVFDEFSHSRFGTKALDFGAVLIIVDIVGRHAIGSQKRAALGFGELLDAIDFGQGAERTPD